MWSFLVGTALEQPAAPAQGDQQWKLTGRRAEVLHLRGTMGLCTPSLHSRPQYLKFYVDAAFTLWAECAGVDVPFGIPQSQALAFSLPASPASKHNRKASGSWVFISSQTEVGLSRRVTTVTWTCSSSIFSPGCTQDQLVKLLRLKPH